MPDLSLETCAPVPAKPAEVEEHVAGHLPASVHLYTCLLPKCKGRKAQPAPDLNTLHAHFKRAHKAKFDLSKVRPSAFPWTLPGQTW